MKLATDEACARNRALHLLYVGHAPRQVDREDALQKVVGQVKGASLVAPTNVVAGLALRTRAQRGPGAGSDRPRCDLALVQEAVELDLVLRAQLV